MTNLLLLIGAGLFSKSVAAFQNHAFALVLGTDVDDLTGTGPGSYDVRGNVWHLDCCSPEAGLGWELFGSIFGWSNNASGRCPFLFWDLFIISSSWNYSRLCLLLDCSCSGLGHHEIQRGDCRSAFAGLLLI